MTPMNQRLVAFAATPVVRRRLPYPKAKFPCMHPQQRAYSTTIAYSTLMLFPRAPERRELLKKGS